MGNEGDFKVTLTVKVKRQFREGLERLKPAERLAVADAWEGIEAELRRDPATFGEPRYATKAPNGTVYHRLKDGISAEFAVYPKERAVIVISVPHQQGLVISSSVDAPFPHG